ncbi:MAG: hypothetical protein ACR2GY_08450 [Phycisphaerales bacterium]
MSDGISTGELIDHLLAREAVVDQKAISFSYKRWRADGTSMLPPGDFDTGAQWEMEWLSIWSDDRYRHEQLIESAPIQEHVGAQVVYTWDGTKAMSASFNRRIPGATIVGIASEIPIEHLIHEFLSWQGRMVFQWGRDARLSTFVRNAERLERTVDGDVTTWKLDVPERANYEVIVRAERTEDGIRLVRASLNAYTDTGPSRTLVASGTLIPGKPSGDFGHLLPQTADFLVQFYPSEHASWALTRVELRAISDAVIDEDTFSIQLIDGMEVSDSRYRLGYVVGSNVLNIDGRVLVVNEPLQGDVGESLERWVASGQYESEIPVLNQESDDHNRTRAIAFWALAGSLSVVVIAIEIGRRRAPRLARDQGV